MEINDIISSGLLELYVLEKTNEQETIKVESWKATYPEVAQELLAIEYSLEQYDMAHAVVPSAEVKNKLLSKIMSKNNDRTIPLVTIPAPVRSINNFWKYAVAASIILLIGSSILTVNYYNKYKSASNDLAIAESKIQSQESTIASLNSNLEVPLNNYSQQVVLKGTPSSPSSTAKIFWLRNTGDVYVEASGLPEVPEGSQYQLWAIIDGKPVDAGMIMLDKNGKKYNIQKMKSFGSVQAFAITLEKEGGSPTPTMEKLTVISTL